MAKVIDVSSQAMDKLRENIRINIKKAKSLIYDSKRILKETNEITGRIRKGRVDEGD